ncbi:hypothetical protein Tco_0553065 [Tanacetum coccineum]
MCRRTFIPGVYIPEPKHPEDLVPAEDEAPIPPLPPSFLASRIRPLSPRALEVEMRDIASSFYHSLHPSGTPPLLPIPPPAPSTSRRADIPKADTPPRKRLLLTTPRPGRITYQVDVCTRESSEFCTRHHDAQKDRAAVRAEIEVLRIEETLAYEQESIPDPSGTWLGLEAGAPVATLGTLENGTKRATRSTQATTTTPAPTATITTTVTNAQLQAMIDQGVNAALAARGLKPELAL